MTRLFLAVLLLCSPCAAKELVTPDRLEYVGSYLLSDDGAGYSHGFTVRRVGDDVRFLMHTWASQNRGPITEWSLKNVPLGGTITAAHRSNRWALGSSKLYTRNDCHDSIWWDHAKNRLWYLQSVDYPDSDNLYSNIQIVSLVDGASSIATGDAVYKVSLEGIRDRKHHGGAVDVPADMQAKYGWGPTAGRRWVWLLTPCRTRRLIEQWPPPSR